MISIKKKFGKVDKITLSCYIQEVNTTEAPE